MRSQREPVASELADSKEEADTEGRRGESQAWSTPGMAFLTP